MIEKPAYVGGTAEEEANDDRVVRLKRGSRPPDADIETSEQASLGPDDAAALAFATTIRVVNRAMIKSGEADVPVPACTVKIGTGAGQVTAQSNAQGVASLDLSVVADGTHPLTIEASHSSTEVPGPGFPQDASVDRIFRPLTAQLTLQGGVPTASDSPEVVVTSGKVRAALKPLWMRTSNTSPRSEPINMIIIHHTGTTNLRSVIQTFLTGETSAHYVVDRDGSVYKLAVESRATWHAGYSYWDGTEGMNENSIGIEILHDTATGLYPQDQVNAVATLVKKLRAAHVTIEPALIIGHSDIAINRPEDRPPKRHGRKSSDPGSAFPWEQLEMLGLGLVPASGDVDPGMYQGVFVQDPNHKLKQGDDGPAVLELQNDLAAVGYFCPADGDFGKTTHWALKVFQEHIWSGSRLRGDDGPWNSGDGRLDRQTALMLKRVLGQVSSSPIS